MQHNFVSSQKLDLFIQALLPDRILALKNLFIRLAYILFYFDVECWLRFADQLITTGHSIADFGDVTVEEWITACASLGYTPTPYKHSFDYYTQLRTCNCKDINYEDYPEATFQHGQSGYPVDHYELCFN